LRWGCENNRNNHYQFAENVVVAEETSMEDARFLILSAVIPYRPFRCTGR